MIRTSFLRCLIYKRPGTQFRSLSGLNLWNEELTPQIKHDIEKHWGAKLPNYTFDENDTSREKYYVLSMFPYPSGHLHMGHVRVYTISDTIARFQRMNGKNVIHPIGWDAFGLPAENAAIDRNIAAEDWTQQNIEHMRKQLIQLGCSFEWDREITTCDPKYYKWTQELFLKLYDNGLIYQKEAFVNWDPIDKTVLADEQVDENGLSWRSGAKVERKLLRQWFVRTTKFAKALLDGLDDSVLHDWRDIIKLQQHWIGDCDGIAFDFPIKNSSEFINVWSNQAEYMSIAKFVVISKSNSLSTTGGEELDTNTKLLDIKAVNPLNNEEIPVFVTDLCTFNSDTHLGIPSVNEEDKIFADKYNLSYEICEEQYSDKQSEAKRQEVLSKGGYYTSAKLRDWLISRQRYWGTPIPIVHCETCGAQPVPRSKLPVTLPKSQIVGRGKSILAENSTWLSTNCPKCGGPAKRETDTMDTFVDSSWYFLRYINNKFGEDMFDVDKVMKTMPVDLYIGGKEHAVLHLYYARFVSHFLHSLGMLPEREPFKRLLVQGMVMGKSYRVKGTGKYLEESQIKVIDKKRNQAICTETNEPVVIQWEKMSKSKHNGVDPSDMFNEYSVNTTRLLILADVAPTSHRNWNSNTFPGVLNWQRRLWLTIGDFIKHRHDMPQIKSEDEFRAHEDYMFDSRNYYVKGTTFNYCDSQQISVAISKLQGLTNSIRRVPDFVFSRSLQFERALACQIILLAPMAPHFASELWSGFISAPNRLSTSREIQWNHGVLEQKWPEVDYDYCLDLVCQVNGFENAVVKMPRKDIESLPKDDAIDLALNQEKIKETLKSRTILDIHYVMHTGYECVVNIIASKPAKAGMSENVDVEDVS